MKYPRFITIAFFAIIAALIWPARPLRIEASAEDPSAGKFSLLIGIDKYRSADVNPLHGAVADALAYRSLLESPKFGFRQQNINLIKDEDATGQGIVNAFEALITQVTKYKLATGKQAVVFFSFSGHGSQVPTPSGVKKPDETDGLDETIVPYDSRTHDSKGDHYDIIDDDIGAFIAAVSAQTDNAVFVFDSCHSGSINRGVGTSREAPRDVRPQPVTQLPRSFPSNKLPHSPFSDENSGDYVIITGSLPEEKSQETDLPDHSTRGLMSYFLEMEMRNVTSDTTYADLMARVAAEVSPKAGGTQHPQVAGSAANRILDGTIKDGPPTISVVDADVATVTITAGQMDGLGAGSLVALYGANQVDPHGADGKIGEGHVTKTFLNRAIVAFTPTTGMTVTRDAKLSARAVLLSPLFGDHPLSISLPEGTDRVVSAVREGLAPFEGEGGLVSIAPAGAKPEPSGVRVRKDTIRQAFCGGLPRTASAAECDSRLPDAAATASSDQVYYIAANSTGEALYGFFVGVSAPEAANTILQVLRGCARQRNLLALENRTSSLGKTSASGRPALQVDLVHVTSVQGCESKSQSGDKVMPRSLSANGFRLPAGACYKIRITNNGDRPLYVTVLDVSTDGAINAMWPKKDSPQQKMLPGLGPVETGVWRVTKPLGYESFKVIATTTTTDYRGLAQGAVVRQRGENECPLTALLDQAMGGHSRGGLDEPPDSDSWSVLSPFTIRIVR